jgi:sulfonate transport system ATP-binding protein
MAADPVNDGVVEREHVLRSVSGRADGSVPTGAVVVTRKLRRVFGAREVLKGIDLEIGPGQFVALLGRSGAGKTTLLRTLAGLDPGAEGDVYVPQRRSVVFQDARLLPWATVFGNVVLGLGRKDARKRGLRSIAEVGLAGHEDDWPKTLSGGEAQRVALARALVREPQLLLLDEPFGALDALTRVRMHALVQALCARYRPAVLFVTHDVDEAVLLADRVLVLTDGLISLDDSINVASPRLRSDPHFIALRSRLLIELGVDETAEGRRFPQRPD